jgi:hypothetical protein
MGNLLLRLRLGWVSEFGCLPFSSGGDAIGLVGLSGFASLTLRLMAKGSRGEERERAALFLPLFGFRFRGALKRTVAIRLYLVKIVQTLIN